MDWVKDSNIFDNFLKFLDPLWLYRRCLNWKVFQSCRKWLSHMSLKFVTFIHTFIQKRKSYKVIETCDVAFALLNSLDTFNSKCNKSMSLEKAKVLFILWKAEISMIGWLNSFILKAKCHLPCHFLGEALMYLTLLHFPSIPDGYAC